MVTIKNKLADGEVHHLIQTIYKTCKSESNLSLRPKNELRKTYDEGRILIAVDRSSLVGWLMLLPYTNKVQELAAGFVVDTYRSKGVFTQLIKNAVTHSQVSMLVTFNKPLYNHLINKVGFKDCSLLETIILSRGKFLLNRLNLERLKAINNHYQMNKPKYLIYKRHE
ncbi:MAG: hypothetical protein UT00_C0013G0007 [Parcubacteria group bacterium GW2011_GWA1_38_7]|nr:MAG: hypothetical protein UT00_C0013G0007 [Parcubacteria group bacterium GW2011_GWA1_38_7]